MKKVDEQESVTFPWRGLQVLPQPRLFLVKDVKTSSQLKKKKKAKQMFSVAVV